MNNPSVLVVASNAFLRSLMADLLRVNDVVCARADGPHDAQVEISRIDPLIVVVDWDMPDGGAEHVIRACGPERFVLVAADTRRVDPSAITRLPGVAGVVRTPLETGSFARVVTRELRRLSILADATSTRGF